MTLKEILDKVEFADILNPLVERAPQCEDNLYSLKEAFDLLRMMTPKPSDGTKIYVDMTDYDDGTPPCLSANYNGQEDWGIMLSREVVISDECAHLPDANIAAILLWDITPWSFSPDERGYLHNREHLEGNPYTDVWQEKFANRWELSKTLASQYHLDEETAAKLHKELLNGNSFSHYYMQSRTPNGNDGEYLAELIRDYFPPKTGSKSIVLVKGPEKNLDDNTDWIWSAFGSFMKLPHPKYIVSPIEGMTNVHVDILVFE